MYFELRAADTFQCFTIWILRPPHVIILQCNPSARGNESERIKVFPKSEKLSFSQYETMRTHSLSLSLSSSHYCVRRSYDRPPKK